MRGIVLSDIIYHIWNIAANYDELRALGMQVSMRERDAGHLAVVKYQQIYQTKEDKEEVLEEDWPEDLPVLEGE